MLTLFVDLEALCTETFFWGVSMSTGQQGEIITGSLEAQIEPCGCFQCALL